jgi:elongation factor Ts
MTISAEIVKTLRERTGAGMMECKKALVETGGDLDAAAEIMRKAGLAKADKKAGRIAAEGTIATAMGPDGRTAVLVEVNCETDFVARQPEFQAFAADVAKAALAADAIATESLSGLELATGGTVDDTRRSLVAKIGEKIDVRRAGKLAAPDRIGSYVHGTRIGVLAGLKGGDDALARDIAMHVAAVNPQYVSPVDVPADVVAKEREILAAQAAAEGKPAAIVEKMVEGRLRKYLAEICLTGQPFVKDPDTTVGALLATSKAEVSGFLRYEVGEGIEKKRENFAADVQAQIEAAREKDKNKDKDNGKDRPDPKS